MEKSELIKIYDLFIKDEHFYNETHQKRIQYFSTMITALIAATIAGILRIQIWWQFLALNFIPILIIIICEIGKKAVLFPYKRLLEAIASRAKIEQELGLTKPLSSSIGKQYWANETIIATRHIDSRKKFENSTKFIEYSSKTGYQKFINQLLLTFQVLGIILIIVLTFLAYQTK